ncbi:unnamed protein product, partial [Aphanomyces euteiches]
QAGTWRNLVNSSLTATTLNGTRARTWPTLTSSQTWTTRCSIDRPSVRTRTTLSALIHTPKSSTRLP